MATNIFVQNPHPYPLCTHLSLAPIVLILSIRSRTAVPCLGAAVLKTTQLVHLIASWTVSLSVSPFQPYASASETTARLSILCCSSIKIVTIWCFQGETTRSPFFAWRVNNEELSRSHWEAIRYFAYHREATWFAVGRDYRPATVCWMMFNRITKWWTTVYVCCQRTSTRLQ